MASTKTRCASALAALLVAGAALAQPTPAPPPARWTLADLRLAFQQADADGDGALTRAEAQQLAILPRPFEELDLNKDGLLTPPEYESGIARAVRPA